MSAGPRIPLAQALECAARCREILGLMGADLVGSARRERETVGDLEFVAPMATGAIDTLYEQIREVCQGREESLFGAAEPNAYFSAVRGVKRDFAYCQLRVKFRGVPGELPVEIHRYTPGPQGNRGWLTLHRTGPQEFGQLYLVRWRHQWRLPVRQPASVDGYLRDADGRAVFTPEESDCFRLLGMPAYPPSERDRIAAQWARDMAGALR